MRSLPIDSATELDLAFLGDSHQSNPSFGQSPPVNRNLCLSPKTPGYESAPSTPTHPPPHPILSSLESSPEFHSPSPSGSPPARGLELRSRRNKIPIPLLALKMDAMSNIDDSGEVDTSDAVTPTPQATACPAYEVFAPDEAMYLATSPAGSVSIRRISESDTMSRNPTTSLAESHPDLPGPSSGQRNLQTKAKTRDGRLRATSSGAAYPQERVKKAKAARNKSKTDDEEDQRKKGARRGPNGRFMKS